MRADAVKESINYNEEVEVSSDPKNSDVIIDLCDKTFKETGAPSDLIDTFGLCIDEIFSNIINYGYEDYDESVYAKLIIGQSKKGKFARLVFVDSGPMFNPIEHRDPDLDVVLEDRQIGGLGIFVVREMMDEIDYKYKNKKNWFSMTKFFE